MGYYDKDISKINDKFLLKLIDSVDMEVEIVETKTLKYYAKIKHKSETEWIILDEVISKNKRFILYNAVYNIINVLYKDKYLGEDGKIFYTEQIKKLYDCSICYS